MSLNDEEMSEKQEGLPLAKPGIILSLIWTVTMMDDGTLGLERNPYIVGGGLSLEEWSVLTGGGIISLGNRYLTTISVLTASSKPQGGWAPNPPGGKTDGGRPLPTAREPSLADRQPLTGSGSHGSKPSFTYRDKQLHVLPGMMCQERHSECLTGSTNEEVISKSQVRHSAKQMELFSSANIIKVFRKGGWLGHRGGSIS